MEKSSKQELLDFVLKTNFTDKQLDELIALFSQFIK